MKIEMLGIDEVQEYEDNPRYYNHLPSESVLNRYERREAYAVLLPTGCEREVKDG